MYKFQLPIGDWSGDGHNECKYYHVSSSKPVDEVREAHYKIEEVTGIDIESVVGVYDEPWIEADIVDKLIDIGFYNYMSGVEDYSYIEEHVGSLSEGEVDYEVDTEIMAHLWIFLLSKVDSDLELQFEKPVEMLPFYGFDEKRRHIGQVGYGLF